MEDTHRCRDCEALITQEWHLCEDCHSDWISWLEKRRVGPAVTAS